MRTQGILVTSSSLSGTQFSELKEWWKANYSSVLKSGIPRKMTIPLGNHYVDFEARYIEVS